MSNEIDYLSWPVGEVPRNFQRPELDQIRELGYEWEDPRDIIDIFEKKIADFSGSKYAVVVDSCTNGLYLCLKYLKACGQVIIPKRTYVSVPMQILHSGCSVGFRDEKWEGIYQLEPYPLYDAATRWRKGMYVGGDSLQVLSFQLKKRVPIGKGGAILTNSEDAYKWLKLACFDGRDVNLYYMNRDHVKMVGYHYNMTPEDAARGIIIMDQVPDYNDDFGSWNHHPDLSVLDIFTK
tara:strand:+ start:3012 stop:3719 length:708 start_codon:yes stop_codon:yes gene_type:complete